MKPFRGTALYCGIGYGMDEIERHLAEAAEAGLNICFTSLQLPESDPETLLSDFPKMAEAAHRHGILIDADIGPRAAKRFGIDLYDYKAIRDFGVDILRLDGGYTLEQTAEASHNAAGLIIEMNAAVVTEQKLAQFEAFAPDKEAIRFCHNFYPMRYTGMSVEAVRRNNALIHRYGYRVAGFIAAESHRRIACGIGLPSVEALRNLPASTAAQASFLIGMDDVLFGDDLAAAWELRALADVTPGLVTLRMRSELPEGDMADWLFGTTLVPFQTGLAEIIRSKSFLDSHAYSYTGDCEWLPVPERRRCGDVTLAKKSYLRYAGEVQIARMELPFEPDMGLVGRIIDEDLPLLAYYDTADSFRFVRA